MFINLNIYSLYVLSIPLVIETEAAELEIVVVDIKFKAPPLIAAGIEVIADKELLLAKLRAIIKLHTLLWFLSLLFLTSF